MVVGTVLVTIDQGVVDFSKLSDRVTLEQLIEVDGVPTFNLFDFPDTADLPAIDIQVAQPPIELPVAEHVFDFPLFNYTDTHLSEGEQSVLPTVDEANNHSHNFCSTNIELDNTDNLSEFDAIPEDDEGLGFELFEEDALIEDVYTHENEFVLINHPFHLAGVKVNKRGDVILDVDEETRKTSRLCLLDRDAPMRQYKVHRISKENKYKKGAIVCFEIFRNHAWLKVGDFHLATEIIKTFRPQFVLMDIEVDYLDGNCENCQLDNIVAKIKTEQPNNSASLPPLPSTGVWTFNKFWDGQLMPNTISSIDGNVASIVGFDLVMNKIAPKVSCYSVNIFGVKYDARKLIWRAFAETEPMYSSEHYKIQLIDENKSNKLSFNNLRLTLVSSIFEQWAKENETWPWTRSKKGTLPREPNIQRKVRARKSTPAPAGKTVLKMKKRAQKTSFKEAKAARMKCCLKSPPPAKKATEVKIAVKQKKTKLNEAKAPQTEKEVQTPCLKNPSLAKKDTEVKRSVHKPAKMMSEKKFKELEFKMQLHITVTEEERRVYQEQRV